MRHKHVVDSLIETEQKVHLVYQILDVIYMCGGLGKVWELDRLVRRSCLPLTNGGTDFSKRSLFMDVENSTLE